MSELVGRVVQSPVGPLQLAATFAGIRMLEFLPRVSVEVPDGESAHLDKLEEELAAYFEGRLHTFTVPLDMEGTEFQMAVWKRLLEIPYGTTTSYGRISHSLGWPGAYRAVGAANGANRIAIVVPCHRVIRADGDLGGYGGGLDKKLYLLELEKAQHQLRLI